jgi:gliding motility-associated-like protein
LYIAQASNQCGTEWDSLQVNFDKCDCTVYLPNGFSPNEDQTNDFYSIYYNCVLESASLIIVDRWGQIIFKSDNPNQEWDGKYNGKDCQEGIYAALLNYKGYSNGLLKQYSIKQAITLVR